MDLKKIPIILRFKLSALPAAKITSEIKKIETKINKLTKEGKDDAAVLKELGDIDKIANEILKANNAKINVIKKPVEKEQVIEIKENEPVLKVAKKELDENERKVQEMKDRLKKSMNSTTGVSTEDKKTNEQVQERVASKEFTKQILDDQVKDKSAHTFISAGKNDKLDITKVSLAWIFIGSWALPLFELMHLLVLSSPFFIIYALVYLPINATFAFTSTEGLTFLMLALTLSTLGPIVFYYASKPFLNISSRLFKLTNRVIDTNMKLNQKNNPFMFVLNHKRILTTVLAIAFIALSLCITFSVMSPLSLSDIINKMF